LSLSATQKKKITATAKSAGTGSLDLAALLWEARNPPPSSNRDPASFDDLIEATNLKRRTLIYLVQVWDRFGPLGIDKDRLEAIGWTKLAIIAETCDPGTEEEALDLACKYTAKELPGVLKGSPVRKKKHVVVLRLSRGDYLMFREALLEHGAKKAKNKVGLSGKESALMKAMGLK
jgi:hypothetical protein